MSQIKKLSEQRQAILDQRQEIKNEMDDIERKLRTASKNVANLEALDALQAELEQRIRDAHAKCMLSKDLRYQSMPWSEAAIKADRRESFQKLAREFNARFSRTNVQREYYRHRVDQIDVIALRGAELRQLLESTKQELDALSYQIDMILVQRAAEKAERELRRNRLAAEEHVLAQQRQARETRHAIAVAAGPKTAEKIIHILENPGHNRGKGRRRQPDKRNRKGTAAEERKALLEG